ncbi:MAG: radical SAM protein [bacterium]|nr:radical SAM protein [bacterium]
MGREFVFQWHITDLCNLRCRHCYQDRFDAERDTSIDIWKEVLNNIVQSLKNRGYTGLSINITGGEPLISLLLFPIMEFLEGLDFIKEINIITNGVNLESHYQKLDSYKKLRYIKVSLEGPDHKSNNFIRGKGNFERVIENIVAISDRVVLMYTLTKINYKKIEDMYKLGLSLGVKGLILERFVPLGVGIEIREMTLEAGEWLDVLKIIADLSNTDWVELLPFKAFFIDLQNQEVLGALCNLGDESMCLMPNGIVYPCRRLPLPLGNLQVESFENILNRLKEFRARFTKSSLKGKCYLCEIDDCIGCRALVYAVTGNIYSEDTQCPKDICARIS